MRDVIIVGGGISGLTAAWKLQQAGKDVQVFEEHRRAGGNVQTLDQDGFRLEKGPNSFMGSSEFIWQLIEEAGLDAQVEPALKIGGNRFIYRDGALHPLPTSIKAFLTSRLLSWRAKMRLAMEPFIRGRAQPLETAWDFFCRRFGREASQYIMSPFVSGVYAGDVRTLGARAAFPKFWDFENERGSMIRGALRYMKAKRKRLKAEGKTARKGLFSMKGGLGVITERLAADLGDSLVTGEQVLSVQTGAHPTVVTAAGEVSARAVVVAVPPDRGCEILQPLAPAAADALAAVPMVPVALIHWAHQRAGNPFPRGFGFLVPRLYDLRLLGTLFPSQLFSHRPPEDMHLMSTYYGGATDPEAASLSESELLAQLRRDHQTILGVDVGTPKMATILRNSKAIPQLMPDHPERVREVVDSVSAKPGFFLAGNYLTGVGIEHAVESGFRAAERCGEYLEGGRA